MVRRRGQPEQFSCEEEAEFRRILDAFPPPPPPDGGRGWLVVLGAFLINVIVDGVCFSFGVLLPHLLIVNEQRWLASLVGSLLLGCCLLSGPLTSALANRYGCRRVAITGSIVAAVGFLIAAATTTPLALAITYGAVAGVGYGMMYLPSILCIGLYFERRRALATAAAVCGSGFGTLVLAPLATWVLGEYGWRGTLVLLAGLALNGLVAGGQFQPLDEDLRQRRKIVLRRMEEDKRIGPRTCSIMQRLLEEKRRHRTTSTGSMNNAVIMHDNRVLRGEELIAALAAAAEARQLQQQQELEQQRQQQQQRLRRRTASASLLEWMIRGTLGRSSCSSLTSARGASAGGGCSPIAGTSTPPATNHVPPLSAQRQLTRPLRQIRSVGSRMSEHYVGAAAAAPATGNTAAAAVGANGGPQVRESFRSLLARRLLPRNASSRSFTSGVCPKQDQERELMPLQQLVRRGEQRPSPLLVDGGVVNPTSVGDDDDISNTACRNPEVIITIEDDGCDSMSDEPSAVACAPTATAEAGLAAASDLASVTDVATATDAAAAADLAAVVTGAATPSSATTPRPVLQQETAVDSPAALTDDLPDSLTTSNFIYHLRKLLSQQDAPMSRQDIYFAGSVANLPEYQAAAGVDSYLKSITVVRPSTAAGSRSRVYAAAADVAELEGAETASAGSSTKTCSDWSHLPCLPDAFKDAIGPMLDLRTLKSPTFLMFSISTILTMLGFFAPFAFLHEAAVEANIDASYAPFLVSLLGISNTIGRIAAGSLANHAWIDRLIVNDAALILAGSMTLLVPMCTTFLTLSIYATVYGLCIAVFVSLRSVIVVELMGLEKLTSAFGQLILFQGCAVIIGTPLTGYLRDITGDYTMTFYASGSLIALSGLLCLPLRRIAVWERCRKHGGGHTPSQEQLRLEPMSVSTLDARDEATGESPASDTAAATASVETGLEAAGRVQPLSA